MLTYPKWMITVSAKNNPTMVELNKMHGCLFYLIHSCLTRDGVIRGFCEGFLFLFCLSVMYWRITWVTVDESSATRGQGPGVVSSHLTETVSPTSLMTGLQCNSCVCVHRMLVLVHARTHTYPTTHTDLFVVLCLFVCFLIRILF